jgi:hypothetical protein
MPAQAGIQYPQAVPFEPHRGHLTVGGYWIARLRGR